VALEAPPTVYEIVITAPSLPPSPADAAFSIIRLDPSMLNMAPRLDDALSQIPGFSLYRRLSSAGANPTTQGVTLRGIAGSAASRALVTLDGVPRNDPFGGWVVFNSLLPESLGEVTVLRGAGAGPYGAGALTGVIALTSLPARAGDWLIDARAGELGQARVAGVATVAAGQVLATFTASAEHSHGWNPIGEGRGPADNNLALTDWTASGRFAADLGRASAALHISAFEEYQGSGLVGASSRERGGSLSLTAAAAPAPGVLGWRAQAWLTVSDLANSSYSVSAGQAGDSLADNEYATPALGAGANAALRAVWKATTLQAGFDARFNGGEEREDLSPVGGVLTQNRRAGGETFVGGAYLDLTRQIGRLLITVDTRADAWETFLGHNLQRPIGGAATLDLKTPDRGGVTPSGRLAARWDVSDMTWLRAALYSGFRPPTLNELFRPFRVGNVVTLNNAALSPETLYGAEAGLGGQGGAFRWSATGFYNRLVDPVTNLTLYNGPYQDAIAGYIPVGGSVLQRENVGAVDAYGLEGDAAWTLTRALSARAALTWTHARVDGGLAAAQLTGLRPAETPAVVATGGLDARLLSRLTLTLDVRYEGQRFVDDRNTLPLASSTVADVRLDWAANRSLTLYLAAANLFNAAVQQNNNAGGPLSYGPPRVISLGLRISGGRSLDAP
jgi:outer membrane receptor protein involved in Fe transport